MPTKEEVKDVLNNEDKDETIVETKKEYKYKIFEYNPQLEAFAGDIDLRMSNLENTRKRILGETTSLSDFANAHEYFGIHHLKNCWVYREWAPAAQALYFTGEFNNWDPQSHPLTPIGNGVWEITLQGDKALWEGCRCNTVVMHDGNCTDHIPLYARRVIQEQNTLRWKCEVVDDAKKFRWADKRFKPKEPLLIYEAHVGMAQEEPRLGSYREFADLTLPRIKEAGYNTIQLMAIMEHPYYGSFGYQVSNFFAASSWFGKPDDLKYLVNTAHKMGIRVLLDVVHSHAVRNTAEGINEFDGTTWQFFHDGPKGDHPAWGTKLFNYGKSEVIHFLLSNLKFWMTEYHFDGFRFDGVTSMLYHDHGLGTNFDSDNKYFSMNTDTDAITYLQLANQLIREVNPNAITIAEDMSGMPGMCLPIEDGGIGFDYRLAMGLPDMWIRLLKGSDDDWDLKNIWGSMCLRRPGEKTVAYAESHDQALVGDKTIMFRMADAGMYTDMEKSTHNINIDRAVALHKMIRLLTIAGGGDAYLNFMGNEFGHPEWIDFPREGNGWSFHYCRRQWSLADNSLLKYQWLKDFDKAMIQVVTKDDLFTQSMPDLKVVHSGDHVLAFERKGLIFVFNFHPWKSYEDYRIPCGDAKSYKMLLSTDSPEFGGWDNLTQEEFPVVEESAYVHYMSITLPTRTAAVLAPVAKRVRKATAKKAKETAPDAAKSASKTRKSASKTGESAAKTASKTKKTSSETRKTPAPKKASRKKAEGNEKGQEE